MTTKRLVQYLLGVAFAATLLAVSMDAMAGQHKVYAGFGLTHWSNIDVGVPFNDDYEDSGDHIGFDVEYQYHVKNTYFFTSLGVGKTQANRDGNGQGWNCSDCDYPSQFRIGVKWQLW